MNFHILTLFPEMVMGGLNTSITGRAIDKGLISVEAVNIRDYSKDKHHHVDDAPYGGGAGMVMQPCPPVRLTWRTRNSRISRQSCPCSASVSARRSALV